MSTSSQPNATLYIKNLNDKVQKEELRQQLFALFTTYGRVIDVVALKTQKMRGQAFIVFSDLAGATAALRACEGIVFYDKPMHIEYAKTKSYATMKREDPDFVQPTSVHAQNTASRLGTSVLNGDGKRGRDGRADEDEREAKKEKVDEDDDDSEEMEIDDDEESGAKGKSSGAVPAAVQQKSARLLCTNLPLEVTDDVLSVLFQQYQGFQAANVTSSPTPNTAGQKCKMAHVFFDSPDLASTAKEALDGFTLKKGWVMSVVYI
ncbi:RNA-binding domain-containing protein [Irpex rosettiformis]|uniref:RNA-binding domain-containing protein n=1 Tax=Irpex rosettiformis TaxID=378272 RepID=A0ACB8U4S2_9APHY|nr:RNA-binding domain-containing protein [Irpex rosettiformis]